MNKIFVGSFKFPSPIDNRRSSCSHWYPLEKRDWCSTAPHPLRNNKYLIQIELVYHIGVISVFGDKLGKRFLGTCVWRYKIDVSLRRLHVTVFHREREIKIFLNFWNSKPINNLIPLYILQWHCVFLKQTKKKHNTERKIQFYKKNKFLLYKLRNLKVTRAMQLALIIGARGLRAQKPSRLLDLCGSRLWLGVHRRVNKFL